MNNDSVTIGKFFNLFVKRLALSITLLLMAFICNSQSIIDEAFLPIIDSDGLVVAYLRKTSFKEYEHPTGVSKIDAYDDKLNLVGYWQGTRKKFFKMKRRH